MRSTIIALAFTSALLSTPTFAAQSAAGTGTADATIVSNLTVTQASGLDFGTITTGSAGGTVTVNSTGSTTSGAVSVTGGSPTEAVFNVTGDKNGTYSISIPTVATLTKQGGGASMGANLTLDGATLAGNTIDNTGAGSFKVGGVLNVGASQIPGSYHGTYNVTVSY